MHVRNAVVLVSAGLLCLPFFCCQFQWSLRISEPFESNMRGVLPESYEHIAIGSSFRSTHVIETRKKIALNVLTDELGQRNISCPPDTKPIYNSPGSSISSRHKIPALCHLPDVQESLCDQQYLWAFPCMESPRRSLLLLTDWLQNITKSFHSCTWCRITVSLSLLSRQICGAFCFFMNMVESMRISTPSQCHSNHQQLFKWMMKCMRLVIYRAAQHLTSWHQCHDIPFHSLPCIKHCMSYYSYQIQATTVRR